MVECPSTFVSSLTAVVQNANGPALNLPDHFAEKTNTPPPSPPIYRAQRTRSGVSMLLLLFNGHVLLREALMCTGAGSIVPATEMLENN